MLGRAALYLLILGFWLWCGWALPVQAGEKNALLAANQGADSLALHVLNRLSFGPKPGDIERIQQLGVEAYIQEQLAPTSLSNPPALEQKLRRLPSPHLTSTQLLQAYLPQLQQAQKLAPKERIRVRQQARRQAQNVLQQAITARLLRATESPQQLQEVMVDFWFNHFNVYARKGNNNLLTGSYENQALRPHVLGRFRDLLGATAKHPAMLTYLDNVKNVAPNPRNPKVGINENYARELLELHTLGVDGGYTQADVVALAHILTGWGVMPRNQLASSDPGDSGFYFDRRKHDFSDKIFLGQRIVGSGEAEGEQVLDLLARHPATARHLSYKLAQYFVSDRPPEALVERLSNTYLESDGNIKAVLDSLFHSREFRDPKYYHNKFKTPYQYVISAIRASNLPISRAERINGILKQMSMGIYDCLTPNGYTNTEAVWLNPDALLRRLTLAVTMSGKVVPFLKPSSPDQLPLKAENLSRTLGNSFSPKTRQVLTESPAARRTMLIFGSPEFMYR